MTSHFLFQPGAVAHYVRGGFAYTNHADNLVDQYFRLWNGVMDPLQAVDEAANIIAAPSWNSLKDAACSYALANQTGNSWQLASHTSVDTGEAFAVVNDGGVSYLLFAWMPAQPIASTTWYWTLTVHTIDALGNLTIVGMCWAWAFGVTSHFPTGCVGLELCGQKTINDRIIYAVSMNENTGAPAYVCFPSIAQIIAHKACALDGIRFVWPGAAWAPGDQYYQFVTSNVVGTNAGGEKPFIILPDAGGHDQMMFYLGKGTMAASTQPVIAGFAATYPNGAMVKAQLPVDIPAFHPGAGAGSLATADVALPAPTALPNCFVDNAVPYTAFTDDVGTNEDGTGVHGSNQYYPCPRITRKLGATFEVGWYHPFFVNDTYTPGNWLYWEQLRLQIYNPATGLFTDETVLRGQTIHIDDIGTDSGFPTNFLDTCGWSVYLHGTLLRIWHFNGPSATGSAQNAQWLGNIGILVGPRPVAKVGINYFKPPPWAS